MMKCPVKSIPRVRYISLLLKVYSTEKYIKDCSEYNYFRVAITECTIDNLGIGIGNEVT